MSDEQDNGGPAFPTDGFQKSYDGYEFRQGMSLRDWFAGQALAGFMANTECPTTYHPDDAAWAYTIADLMLAERAKVKP